MIKALEKIIETKLTSSITNFNDTVNLNSIIESDAQEIAKRMLNKRDLDKILFGEGIINHLTRRSMYNKLHQAQLDKLSK